VLYAGGQPARLGNPGDAVFTYVTQPDFPSPPGAIAANDLIYVDAWERGVSFLEDPALQDPGLNGADMHQRKGRYPAPPLPTRSFGLRRNGAGPRR